MRFSTTGIASLALVALSATAADAQVCLGSPSFDNASTHLEASYQSATGAKGYSAAVQKGGVSLFGGLRALIVKFEGGGPTGKAIGVNGGIQVPLGAASIVSLCPVLQAGLSSGPNSESYKTSGRSIDGGLALGANLEANDKLRLLPSAAFHYISGKSTTRYNGEELGSFTDSYKILTTGLGFYFDGSFAITPYVEMPVGIDGAENTYGFRVSFAVGKRQ